MSLAMMLVPEPCAVLPRSLRPYVHLCRVLQLPWSEASMDGSFIVEQRCVRRLKSRPRRRPVEFLANHENR